MNFCTCYDSYAVVACAKIYSNTTVKSIIKAEHNFHPIWILHEKSLVWWILGQLSVLTWDFTPDTIDIGWLCAIMKSNFIQCWCIDKVSVHPSMWLRILIELLLENMINSLCREEIYVSMIDTYFVFILFWICKKYIYIFKFFSIIAYCNFYLPMWYEFNFTSVAL